MLIPEFFPDGLLRNIAKVITALDAAIVRFNPAGVVSGPGVSVNDARKRMSALLKSAAFTDVRNALNGVENEQLGVVGSIVRREFALALEDVKKIERIRVGAGVTSLSEATINAALSTNATEYTIDFPVGPPFKQTVPGYAGPAVTTTQRFRLSDYSEFLAGGAERSFRLPLLRAECLMGLRDFAGAIRVYEPLLSVSGLSAARKTFAAVKAGYAHLELGDATYRRASSTRLIGSARRAVRAHYDAAVAVLDRHGVRSDDPDRADITRRARRARAQLDAGLNVVGLRDSFVPVQRYSHLLELASAQIDVCLATAREFEEDLKQAEDELGDLFNADAERKAEENLSDISALQVTTATLTEQQVADKVAMIEAQQDFLDVGFAIAGIGKIIEAGATFGIGAAADAPSAGNAEKLGSIAGVGTAVVDFLAQRNELGHQLEMAKIEQKIATNQTAIATLQQQLSTDRLAHLERKARFLKDKRMNADFLYARAAIGERRVERHLQVCIVLAYLCERALAFFLGKPDVKHIRFDYIDTEPGVVAAVRELRSGFKLMQAAEEAALGQERSGSFVERLSLRENYPLQFQNFLESDDGRMEFVYSLYQLSKNRPATHQCRLYQNSVGVEVKGLVPDGELRGTLTHSGRFLVRDKRATLDPPQPTRLVPTDIELQAALREQQEQGTAVAAVGGVLFYALDVAPLDLSQASAFVPPPPPTFTLSTFEGYAPTGFWTLQVENHRRLDITDIVLHFGIVNRQSDPDALRTRVRELVTDYEIELANGDNLDRVDVFSLRQQFPDAFFALENGPATIELEAEAFPGLTDLRFKTVVIQALDQDNDGLAGIEVVIRRNDVDFSRQRVTGVGGFSENLDAPLDVLDRDDRFPLLGAWQLALTDRSRFAQLGDLRLFVMYAYAEN